MDDEDFPTNVSRLHTDAVVGPKLHEVPTGDRKTVAIGGRLARAQRKQRILELRAAGMTAEQIAEVVGTSKQSVAKIIGKALKEWAEDTSSNVEMVRQQKLYELDQLKRAIWPRALRGELAAVREAARIIQIQARISGAEAPVKVEREVSIGIHGIDNDEIDRLERAWLESGSAVIDSTAEEIDGETR